MKVAFVAPQVPWPLDTGGKIRTFHLAMALARRFELSLVAFDTGGRSDLGPLADVVSNVEIVSRPAGPVTRMLDLALGLLGGPPVTIRRYEVPGMAQLLQRVARSVDVVHFDSLHTAQYREELRGVPAVLDEHNVEAVVWERVAQHVTHPLRRRLLTQQASRVRAHEAERLGVMDAVLCCSDEDRDRLGQLAPGVKATVVPNGVALHSFDGVEAAALPGTPLVFVGSMDWAPNADAARWFASEVLPLVRAEVPDAHFYAVGRNPPPDVRALDELEGVTVRGNVPDVKPYILGAQIVPVPLRSGSGTRLKILEALAAERPVVSTTIGAEGLQLAHGEHLLLADGAAQLAAAIIDLAGDARRRRELGAAGRRRVEERYAWRAIGDELADFYAARFG